MNIISYSQNCEIKGFHGTDFECISKIDEEGFKILQNDDHWIANGVYFFLDSEKAEWWTKQENKGFGVEVYNPVIITAIIKYQEKKYMCDLRLNNDYLIIRDMYDLFMQEILKRGGIKNAKVKQINNMFFEWVKRSKSYKVFIVGFDKTALRDPRSVELRNKMKIIYTEYQMCVCDSSIIEVQGYSPLSN